VHDDHISEFERERMELMEQVEGLVKGLGMERGKVDGLKGELRRLEEELEDFREVKAKVVMKSVYDSDNDEEDVEENLKEVQKRDTLVRKIAELEKAMEDRDIVIKVCATL
jgi:uncharacterized protein YgfB (UPF0149 family)